jgi:hypothetical protein
VDPKTCLEDTKKLKFLTPPELELQTLGSRYTDWATVARVFYLYFTENILSVLQMLLKEIIAVSEWNEKSHLLN